MPASIVRRIYIPVFVLIASVAAASAPPDPGGSKETIARVEAYLQKAERLGYSGSVLVGAHGKILYRNGFGMANRSTRRAFAAETVFDIGSITKQFTATAILKLEMAKKLRVEDPISRYLDGVPEDKKGITIHQLLTHTSGLTDSLGMDEELVGREEYLKLALGSPLIQEPGTYAYSNVGYSLLAAIVEIVSGQEYEKFLQENLFRPAGMTRTGYVLPGWKTDDLALGYRKGREWGTTYDRSQYTKGVTWHLKGNGGIHSTVDDMYRWMQALQGNGVLNAAERKKLFEPHVSEGGDSSYAYGWSVRKNDRGETVIGHNGGNGFFMATVLMIPSSEFAVIVSCNSMPWNTDAMAERIDRAVFENMAGLEESFIELYSGTYALPDGSKFTIRFNENDAAVAVLDSRPAFLLLWGASDDDPEKASEYDRKTMLLLDALKSGELSPNSFAFFEAVPEEATLQIQEVKRDMEEQYGTIRSVESLGSVSRRNGTIYVSAGKIRCEKKDVYQVFLWRGDRILDIREPEEESSRSFEHQQANHFYADTNSCSLEFRKEDGKPVAVITRASGETIARKAP